MATKMTMVQRDELDTLLDVAAEWLDREERYSPGNHRRRQTSASKRRDKVREIISRNRAILRIFGG